MQVFSEAPFRKGNLHTHTTRSDGRLDPEQTLAQYRRDGYAFVAITDHDVLSQTVEGESFTALSGIELATEDHKNHKAFHLIGIGLNRPLAGHSGMEPTLMQKALLDAGGLVVLGHPAWSLLDSTDLLDMNLCFATEIYSGISEGYSGRGNSSVICDAAAAKHCKKMLLGVDDRHFGDLDYQSAWVMLQTPSLSRSDILQSLAAGRFYASEGPDFRQVTMENGIVSVQCSPVRRVAFFSDSFWSGGRICLTDTDKESAEYHIQPQDHWLRVEIMDANGKKATTQYLPVIR